MKKRPSTGSASVDKALKTKRPTVAQVNEILATQTEQPYVAPTDERRVDWLLGFVQRDLVALRVGEAIDLSTDVVEYLDPRAVFAQGADAVEALKQIAIDRQRFPKPTGSKVGTEHLTEADVFTLPRATLQQLQVALREGLQRLESGEGWVIDTPPQMVVARAGKTLVRNYYAGAILPVLIASTVDLLVSVWPSIGRCQYDRCNKLFRRDHGSKQYCTPQCSQNARSHRMGRDFKQEYSRRWDSDRKKGKK